MNDPIIIFLDVTAEDIRNGTINDFRECPIALSLTRALHLKGVEFEWLSIGPWPMVMRVYNDWVCVWEAEIPKIGQDFIDAFDNENLVSPVQFDAVFYPITDGNAATGEVIA